jgi:predicted alpha/beta hydrolase family esterase
MPGPEHSSAHLKRQVLFIQGGGKGAHDEWDNRLVASLERELGSNYEIRYPRMPNEDDPHYTTWKAALNRELAALGDDPILVGHSIGGTMLVNAISEQSKKRSFAALFLIAAPFVGDGGWPSDEMKSPQDLGARLPKDVPVHIYHGLKDEEAPPSHADLYGVRFRKHTFIACRATIINSTMISRTSLQRSRRSAPTQCDRAVSFMSVALSSS